MRLNAVGEGPTRMPINETNSGTLQNAILSGLGGSRMNIAPPPPPPPPYPGPPPPYPGSTNNQNQVIYTLVYSNIKVHVEGCSFATMCTYTF